MANKKDFEGQIKELNELLAILRRVVLEDRRTCIEWYEELKGRWDEDEIMSEMAAVEREINNALKNAITATDKVPKILDSISKIISALVKERALVSIAQGGEREIDADDPMARLKLLPDSQKELPADVVKMDKKLEKEMNDED